MTAAAGAALERARMLAAGGRLAEAERAFRELAASTTLREEALQALADLYEQGGRDNAAADVWLQLADRAPDRLYYCARLAGVLERLGRSDDAIARYQRLLARQPGLANAQFNVALLYRKNKRYAEAVAAYEEALKLGIDGREEVYSNLGVLYSEMRRAEDALAMFRRSLECRPDYVPALFNLAGLLEEQGERAQAIVLYERILAADARHWESLSRLAYARRFTRADDPLLETLRRAVHAAAGDPPGCEALYFALGKALDDLGQYDEAFAAYRSANEFGRRRNPSYDRRAVESAFDTLIDGFTGDWLRRASTGLEAGPIFICGMLRSGSTLIEQILASHPAVTVGGELDFLPWLIQRDLLPYPQRAVAAGSTELGALGNRYLKLVESVFPGAAQFTDKRPDNFLHLGLIKAVFPRARIVYTRRSAPDNCLSIYFQQLGGNLNYATDLANIAHYYREHERLMRHWFDVLGEGIHTVDYDELVRAPEAVLRGLLSFLGLEWDDRCLNFDRASASVKTASVWQVREPLHRRSSGRWRAYERHLGMVAPAGQPW